MSTSWLDKVKWDAQGLVPVIAQELGSNKVLMFAWMNREALQKTVATKQAHYWSRSRNKLWHKGEESGHTQQVHDVRLDCDEDVILLTVEQTGGVACHTGRHNCFFQQLQGDADNAQWQTVEPVLKDPRTLYEKTK
ncbi:MAG: phosphoribosyl-AMP cyclohydrolase [Burkholderiaceae bacterium]|nr:MAG: phosphoribosyl-AMP cyclohydrolase [Burkholderiaceae bacterium]